MLHEYETYLQEKGFSPNTVISYLNDVNQFLKDLHLRPGDYVTSADIRKWIHQMLNPEEGKPLAISTINRRLNSLRSFYAWAVEHHKIEQNPMKDIQDLKSADEDNEKVACR
nr:site-specific integrase [Geobacillus thermocatenulatus]